MDIPTDIKIFNDRHFKDAQFKNGCEQGCFSFTNTQWFRYRDISDEKYTCFFLPPLRGPISCFALQFMLRDQMWGQMDGEVWIRVNTIEKKKSEYLFRAASHNWECVVDILENHPIVTESKRGDLISILRKLGDHSGQELHIAAVFGYVVQKHALVQKRLEMNLQLKEGKYKRK